MLAKKLFITCCLLLAIIAGNAQNKWPKDIVLQNGGKVTLYQPQPESLDGNKLTSRAAISVRNTAGAEPIFGAIWTESILDINKDDRTATLESITVTNAKFSDSATNSNLGQISTVIQQEVPKWNLTMSLDQLLTSIQQDKQVNDANLKNDPPQIIYRKEPSTLVLIDGAPKLQQDADLKIERVINTPFLIVKNPGDGQYYLYANDFWYRSSSVTEGYTYVTNLPAVIQQLDATVKANQVKNNSGATPDDTPKTPVQIIVSTDPAELIQTEGEADYSTVAGTSLLYANNTLDEIFKDINTQKTFTLISGRWYSAPNLNGPWVYTPSDQLPADFANIPKGSEKDGVLANVAGTDEAQDAMIDAEIPQTAKVDRKTATCTVTYDGDPKFSPIDGTSLQTAENSNITVLLTANGVYYAMQDGVWFSSNSPTGPWTVANERPADVDNIPPSDPAYNTKYVYIYDNTADYVYTGYTPGYLGCYVYGSTVVYGTGWRYRPWYGRRYYPRPVTYGFGFCYNPWTGWNMGFSMVYNFGWFHVVRNRPGWGGGWFGPPAYRPPYRHWGYNGGYYNRSASRPAVRPRPNIAVNRPVIRTANGVHVNSRTVMARNNNNIYNNRSGVATRNIERSRNNIGLNARPLNTGGVSRPGGSPRPGVATPRPSVARPATGSNNVFTDRQGNVFKNDNNGNWQQRDNKTWKPVDNNSGVTPQLDKDRQARDRGNDRTQNYQNNNPAPPPSRPAPRPVAPQPAPRPAPAPRPMPAPAPRPMPMPAPRPAPQPAPRPAPSAPLGRPGRG